MKRSALVCLLLLAGCSSTPMETKTVSHQEFICIAEHRQDGKPVERMNDVVLYDYGNRFDVRNQQGKVVLSTPELKQAAGKHSLVATNPVNKLVYAKGIDEDKGFYGVFTSYKESVTFNCR